MTEQNAMAMELLDTNDTPTISGRELYRKLEIETPYHKWFPRMCAYGFTENQDFFTEDKIVRRADGAAMPQTQHDHQVTIDMAKEICMLQRTEQGKAVRRYLLELERKWNSPEAVIARALQMANAKMERLTSEIQTLQSANSELAVQNEIMLPKAAYFDALVDRGVNLSFRESAKQLQVKERAFIAFLLDKKYLYRDKNGHLRAYAQYINDLFVTKEGFNDKTNWKGVQTLVTPKGRETFRLLMQGV